MYNLIIFGPPGVGKGTQAEFISKELGLFHLSTGEYLRKAISEGTELGKKAKELVDNGKFVPDDIMIGIVKEALEKNSTENGFILDGFPRTIEQAKALSEIFEELDFKNIKILHLTANNEELLRRLLNRGRVDDTEEIVKNRLTLYSETTKPVIDYYTGFGIVQEIDAVGEVEAINKLILLNLKNHN